VHSLVKRTLVLMFVYCRSATLENYDQHSDGIMTLIENGKVRDVDMYVTFLIWLFVRHCHNSKCRWGNNKKANK
jgi:hypothetical protein